MSVLDQMLEKYRINSQKEAINAIKEIIQEIALVGLWRAKFFEHAAFFGGTALRVLYGLNRFSEDLGFSLLKHNENFSLEKYNKAVQVELLSLGIETEIKTKEKTHTSSIKTAFIKANTLEQLLHFSLPKEFSTLIQSAQSIKIKMEVDQRPPLSFSTESKMIWQPIPVPINTFTPESLFAGKIHACLCRPWGNRVKGRDWYDLVWLYARGYTISLEHLNARLEDTNPELKDQTSSEIKELLTEKIESIDFDKAIDDVKPFLTDSDAIAVWSQAFFKDIIQKLQFVK